MTINLLSPNGEKTSIKLGLFYFFNEKKAKKLIKNGWTCQKEEDAELAIKFNLF